LLCCYIVRCTEGAEEEGPATHGATPTSTSHTGVLSEENRTAMETSPPPERSQKASTPEPSPRAPPANKARIGAGHTQEVVAGSSSTPFLEDVSYPLHAPSLLLVEFFLSEGMFLSCQIFATFDEGSDPPGLQIYWVPR
jgi:hypothetical protein